MAVEDKRVTVRQALSQAAALHRAAKLGEAEALCRRVLEAEPGAVEAHVLLGVIALQRGDLESAAASFRQAVALKPDFAEARFLLGNALLQERRLEEAAASYAEAIALRPGYAEAYGNLGVALKQQGKLDEAVASFRRALAAKPDFANAHYNLGTTLQSLKRLDEALACFKSALTCKPDDPRAFGSVVNINAQICAWGDWAENQKRLLELVRAGAPLSPFHLLTSESGAGDQLACARRYVADLVPVRPAPLWPGQNYPEDKIRIGYLSSGFQEHPTAHLIAELFEKHDRERFEVFGFSFGPNSPGDMRRRLEKALDRFVDVALLNNLEIARRIRDMGVGIAVDLDGYTTTVRAETGRRAAILAHRPAPVQANYLGYPGTLGADFIDYIVVDPFIVPMDQQPFFAERLVHLPECYQVNDTKRTISSSTPSRAECGLPANGFVFCCFNNNYKITPAFFDIWMRLLHTVPGSVLWLLRDNQPAERNLRREAQKRGVDPKRLVFAPRLPLPEHLARHRIADLFLDTLPCNAHTTASDALWAGLPVLTCAGTTFAGRVAGSLLNAVGLPELVTGSLEEYEALAVKLAAEPLSLRALRAKLEANRNTAPLFDIDRTRRHIEAAFAKMWDIFRSGRPPEAFAVAPIGE